MSIEGRKDLASYTFDCVALNLIFLVKVEEVYSKFANQELLIIKLLEQLLYNFSLLI